MFLIFFLQIKSVGVFDSKNGLKLVFLLIIFLLLFTVVTLLGGCRAMVLANWVARSPRKQGVQVMNQKFRIMLGKVRYGWVRLGLIRLGLAGLG